MRPTWDQLAAEVVTLRDQVRALQQENARLGLDGLTGLPNRGALDQAMASEWGRWKRTGTPMALLMIDVDHFKRFNDEHGHQAGDEVLRHVGAVLGGIRREHDTLGRYGGEEFTYVVSEITNRTDAEFVGERVRGAIEIIQIPELPPVTVSVGVALSSEARTLKELVSNADTALYRAKDAGRNCVEVY